MQKKMPLTALLPVETGQGQIQRGYSGTAAYPPFFWFGTHHRSLWGLLKVPKQVKIPPSFPLVLKAHLLPSPSLLPVPPTFLTVPGQGKHQTYFYLPHLV